MSPKEGDVHRPWVSVVSGFNSGVLGLLVGHPFDTLKVRMQVNETKKFTGSEIRSLYRGIGPPMIGMGIQTAGNFGVYANTRHYLENNYFGDKSLAPIFFGGMTAGLSLSLVSLPVTVIKVQQQMSSSGLNMVKTAQRVLELQGAKGLYRGALPHFVQTGGGRGCYMITYELMKRWLKVDPSDGMTGKLIICGGCAGWGGWIFLYPFDVVRNNIFADWQVEKQYNGTLDCVKKVYERGGIRAFYKGMQYTLLRAFPTAAISLSVYDITQTQIYLWLRKQDS